jgi:hypothetical protein
MRSILAGYRCGIIKSICPFTAESLQSFHIWTFYYYYCLENHIPVIVTVMCLWYNLASRLWLHEGVVVIQCYSVIESWKSPCSRILQSSYRHTDTFRLILWDCRPVSSCDCALFGVICWCHWWFNHHTVPVIQWITSASLFTFYRGRYTIPSPVVVRAREYEPAQLVERHWARWLGITNTSSTTWVFTSTFVHSVVRPSQPKSACRTTCERSTKARNWSVTNVELASCLIRAFYGTRQMPNIENKFSSTKSWDSILSSYKLSGRIFLPISIS